MTCVLASQAAWINLGLLPGPPGRKRPGIDAGIRKTVVSVLGAASRFVHRSLA
jgi:hypothetical protein